MSKTYEKPIAELVDFTIRDSIMTAEPDGEDPIFSEGVEDW